MKIDQVKIQNFKGIRDFCMKPSKVNILIGSNGTGKSSVLQALRYGLTGNAPQAPIRSGAEKAVVDLSFSDIGMLSRTIYQGKNEVRLNGKITTQKSINDLFANRSGASTETADILTSAEVLSCLSSGELSSYFLDNNLLSVKVDIKLLLEFCNLTDESKTQLGKEFGAETIDMADIDRVWNNAKLLRKKLKQELKEATVKAKGIENPTEDSAEEIDKKLRILLRKQAEIYSQQNAYKEACRRREKDLSEISKRKERLGELISQPDESLLEKLTIEIECVDKELQKSREHIAFILDTGNRLKRILDELELSTCPISSKLICTTDKSSIRTELTSAIEKEREEYKKQKEIITALEARRKELINNHKLLEKQISQYHNQQILHEQIQYLEKNLLDEPEMPAEADMHRLTEEIRELNEKQKAVIEYMISLEYEDLRQQKEKEVAMYEEIVRELDPRNGVRQKVLEHSLKPLEDYFNNNLRRLLPKYSVRLDCSNGFAIKLIDGVNEYDAAKSASAGERGRIWFVLMDLINALSSYRILIYDNTDGMDIDSLLQLLDMLDTDEVQQRYDHIFISMIDYNEVQKSLNQKKGIAVFPLVNSENKKVAA